MPPFRPASHPGRLALSLALSLACAHCGSDAGDSGADSYAGSSAHAGTSPSTGGHAGSALGGAGNAGNAAEGGASGEASSPPAGAGGETAAQGGAGGEPADAIPDFNGCVAADYEDQSATDAPRIIGIATQGLSFTPPCLTIKAGQTVRWEGSLSSHPLAPGNPDDASAGSPDNPIRATSSGQSVEFEFPDAGTYPYYCELHSFGNGQGMAGVVHVKP